ncbi:allophanate hydrolase subunit 1 [Alteribacillus sp. JSM 102045]|uniref:5-oxoprolinase subunit B family protein n=1 Tax=Alteribacillus sp. JSM 102045 TaxID=1562101 RepID=UPI0035C22097
MLNDFKTRYSYGGDEFIFVELSEEMSLDVNFQAMAITKKMKEKNIPGILDVCPSNASYMVRYNPDQLDANDLIEELKQLESSVENLDDVVINSRLVDVPILFEDPWTHEAVMQFRDRHQDPDSTDIEYAASINGYDSKADFIKAITGAPFLVSMIGFVPGLPFCFQIVPREEQIEVPKYVRPRTFTPERCFGFGGGFSVIYPAQGAGGYQMFGIAAAPVFDKEQKLPDFKESMVFPRQGDIFRYRDVTREEYDAIREEVEAGIFEYHKKDFTFKPDDVLKDPRAFSEKVLRRLYHD